MILNRAGGPEGLCRGGFLLGLAPQKGAFFVL
jgi:hypothetical protein